MTPTLVCILSLHTASRATQEAHAALVALGLTDAAQMLHQCGETIAMALGKVVKHEAERRHAEAAP